MRCYFQFFKFAVYALILNYLSFNMSNNTLFGFIKKFSFTFLFLLISFLSFSQTETNFWYFGNNAGLNFNTGELAVLENGAMQTPAGCASVSDREGNLLFYSNGQTVWNKNHQILENGQNLNGDISGIQNAIIIPKPNDEQTFYLFYTRENVQTAPLYVLAGIYYAEIKFDEQHPLGYVTENKNIQIAEGKSTNRIAAVHYPETNSIRVICITKDDPVFGTIVPEDKFIFRIFNVTQEGVNLTPIKRQINEGLGTLGAMKIAPDASYVVFADTSNKKIYFHTFDNENVTFQLFYTLVTVPAFGVSLDPYGIEFSQDSQLFYYSGNNNVVQFPLSSLGSTDGWEFYLMPVAKAGALQLARNGKIYIAQGASENPIDHLAVIHNPERIGEACNFQFSAIPFASASSTKGLPIFIASSLRNRIIPSADDCVNVPFTFDLDAYTDIQSVVWDFGDGGTSTDFEPTHLFSTPGIHKVKATIVLQGIAIDLYKKVEAYPLPFLAANQILSQCDVDNDGQSVFNLENIKELIEEGDTIEYTFYHSLEEATNDANPIPNQQFYVNVANPETVFVRMVSPNACASISSFVLENYQPNTQPISDFFVCENSDNVENNMEGKFNLSEIEAAIRADLGLDPGFTVDFYASLINAQTKIDALDRYYNTVTTIVWVRIEDDNFNCFGVIPFNAIVNSSINVDIESNYKICDLTAQPPTVLDGGINNDIWTWKKQNGTIVSTDRLFQITQPGAFSVTVEKTENNLTCSLTKKFTVVKVTDPTFVSVKAENGTVAIKVQGNSTYAFSIDGINFYGNGISYTFEGVSAGTHTVYVKDVENCEKTITQDIYLITIPNFFTPNNDSYNDIWKVEGLSSRFYFAVEILIFDRYGRLLHKMNMQENQVGWNGTYNKQILPATDYWYKISLTDLDLKTIVKSGHFSLMR